MDYYSNVDQQPKRRLDSRIGMPKNEAMVEARGVRKMICHRFIKAMVFLATSCVAQTSMATPELSLVGPDSAARVRLETNTTTGVGGTVTVTDLVPGHKVLPNIKAVGESGDISGIAPSTLPTMLGINVDENTTGTITTLVADDLDSGDGTSGVPLTYTTSGGWDSGFFTADSATGAPSFRTAQNVEAQSDRNGGNQYRVKVKAYDDEGANDEQLIPVALQNINEAPTATNLSDTVGDTEDAGTVTPPVIEVSVEDQGSLGPVAGTVTLEVIPVNDTPIVDDQPFDVDENAPNGTFVGKVVAYNEESDGCTPPDPDCQEITFSITGTAFDIDDAGNITVANTSELDRETLAEFTPTVTVTDDGAPVESADAIITISLNPLNDNTPEGVDDEISVEELATVVFNVLTLGVDLDADVPQPVPVTDVLVVSEVDGDPSKVGMAQELVTDGDIVGSLTISKDGSATFVANANNTIEQFEATQTYTVSDGTFEDAGVTVTVTLNPLNDNQPALTSDGVDFATAGVVYDEGARTSSNRLTIPLNGFFSDLDIDADGMLDSLTSGDNDSLVYVVTNNTNLVLIKTEISSGELMIYSPSQEHGTADITVTATDTAAPSGNISSVDLDFTITVNSVNDAPIYIPGSYNASGYTVEEDSGDIPLPLEAAFSDQDIIGDSIASDDSITYTITVVDVPAVDAVETVYIDLPFTVLSDDEDVPAVGSRTTVYETTDASMVIKLAPDGHGYLDVTVRATDAGRPPAVPADSIPLFDQASFRITVQGIGDDTPLAEPDHYSEFVGLVMEEDGDPIIFDVLANDYRGDVPAFVISAGQTITDSSGFEHTWRSTSRIADRNNVGDFVIEMNGEVSCANAGCQDDQSSDTTIKADAILDNSIMYKPTLDFNGEDSFTYCLQDTFPADETPSAFTPPNDVRCATVTVNVTPVNDLPRVPSNIIYEMEQAGELIVTLDNGLATKVTGVDNTHVDGLGCNPADPDCVQPVGRPVETLYFSPGSNGLSTFTLDTLDELNADGTFIFRPNASFSGSDSFLFNVCETPVPSVETCVFDVLVTIVVDAIQGAPAGLSEDVVEVDFDLANIPLELPVGPEANVLIVNDDSGSMAWDILTDQNNGLYYFDSGNYIYYTMKATAGSSTSVAPPEKDAPNQGLWRLRNSTYNKTYYNPEIRYEPWSGLSPDDVEFPNSDPAAALHNPLAPSGAKTDLTLAGQPDYTGRAVISTPRVCTEECRWYRRGRCRAYRTVCTDGNGFQNVLVENLYLPHYYVWDNQDLDEIDDDDNSTPELDLDALPSPYLSSNPNYCVRTYPIDVAAEAAIDCPSDGLLVEIKSAANGGSDIYPRPEGRTDCVAVTDVCTFDEEIQNFANWFTYSRNREFTAKSALGKVVAASKNIRVGYAKLNSSRNVQRIKSMNTSERTGTKADLLNAIYLTESSGGTPLRRTLRDAGRHFACEDNDIFNSNSNSAPGDSNCPIFESPVGNCQQNFTLLISDGAWNGGDPGVGNEDDDGDTNFDGGRYAASYNNSLADVAMEYYEFDLHSTLPNEVPTSARDIEGAAVDAFEDGSNFLMHQHMKTFTVGFGVNGLISDEDVPTEYDDTTFTWGDPTNTERKIDDMRHAAVNGRGQYLSAGNAATLTEALVSVFEEFQQGSGTASAVSFNSQEIFEDTLVFRSFYNTKNNTGDLIAQVIDLDGSVDDDPIWNASLKLDEKGHDARVILTYDRYLPAAPETNVTYAQGIPFRPAYLNVGQRAAFSVEPAGPQQDLEVNQRVAYLRGDDTNERPTGNFRERPDIGGRLGDIVHSAPTFIGIPSRLGRDAEPYPQRSSDLYSKFRADNENRRPMVYVAANDGMLHGFDAETGEEAMAYVPNNLMTDVYSQKITDLVDFEYTHQYFVDSTPAVNDVFIDVDQDGDKEWRTILISGQGAGGKAYFALDVTDPGKTTDLSSYGSFDDLTASQVVLWEFTDKDDSYPTDEFGDPLLVDGDVDEQRQDLLSPAQPVKDLGYTYSVPTIVMSNLIDGDGHNKWVSITSNGYNSTAGIGKLLVLFLEGGLKGTWCHPDKKYNVTLDGTTPLPNGCLETSQDFVKLDTGFGVEAGLPNGLGEPRVIDVDGNGTADYAYAGDLQGNFFRFNLTDPDFRNWDVTKIFKAQYKPGERAEKNQPITTQPIAIIHPTEEKGYIILFATGAYLRTSDSTDPAIQSFYGIWDRLGPELIDKSDLVEQRYTNLNTEFGPVRTSSQNTVDYSVVENHRGWFIDLNSPPADDPTGDAEYPGEKAIRNIQLRGGIGFVNSIFPRSVGSCVGRAGGATLGFCPDTGGTECLNDRVVFDRNNDGAFDEDDRLSNGELVAAVIILDPFPPTDSTFIGDKRVTQYGRELHVIGTNTSSGSNTGRLSWKRLETID